MTREVCTNGKQDGLRFIAMVLATLLGRPSLRSDERREPARRHGRQERDAARILVCTWRPCTTAMSPIQSRAQMGNLSPLTQPVRRGRPSTRLSRSSFT